MKHGVDAHILVLNTHYTGTCAKKPLRVCRCVAACHEILFAAVVVVAAAAAAADVAEDGRDSSLSGCLGAEQRRLLPKQNTYT